MVTFKETAVLIKTLATILNISQDTKESIIKGVISLEMDYDDLERRNKDLNRQLLQYEEMRQDHLQGDRLEEEAFENPKINEE